MILSHDDPQALIRAAHVLKKGGVAILPCDTIYGIVGIAPDTRERILEIKGRGENRPFLMLIAETAWINEFSGLPLPVPLKPFWPGPLTILFPHRAGGKVGFRLPEDQFLAKILSLVGRPLYSTSVNLTGQPHLFNIEEIKATFREKVNLIIEAGDLPESAPSTIVDITTVPYRLVRQGALHLPEKLFKS